MKNKSHSVRWWWPVRRMKEKRLRLRELLFIVLVVRSLWYGVFSEEYINEMENLIMNSDDDILIKIQKTLTLNK